MSLLTDIELLDIERRPWNLRRDFGTRTVVFCFASWCTCKAQLPAWQRYWDECERDFAMVGVGEDVQGFERLPAIVEEAGVHFPVLVDPTCELGRQLSFQVVPSGFFVEADGTIAYRHTTDFDIADPRVQMNLDRFLEGRRIETHRSEEKMDPEALRLFAEGVQEYREGRQHAALDLWQRALELDPDNFLIRSQIWTVKHPERFYPVVDRDWQELQLVKEGYGKPLP